MCLAKFWEDFIEKMEVKKFAGMKFLHNWYGDSINLYSGGKRMSFRLSNGWEFDTSVGWGHDYFVLDVESDGLYGAAIAIAAYVFQGGEIKDSFEGRVPDRLVTNDWVKKNILPAISGIETTHKTSEALEEAFWEFWMKVKDDRTVVICHMPFPVESGIFSRCIMRDIENRQWQGPYPGILDVSWELARCGYKSDSVDDYINKLGYLFNEAEKNQTHDPRYDAKAAYSVYLHMKVMNGS